jgi:anti-sigma factor RsiW
VALDADAGELVSDEPAPAIDDLVRGLRHLPFNQRAALVMRELEGRPLAEIATALEVSTPAVETLLFRARRALREQLEGGLSCFEAERAISRQLDGTLPRAERGALRAHLRECPECATLARRVRAQRGAMRSMAALPLPLAISWDRFSHSAGVAAAGGGAPLAGSLAAKLAIGALATSAAAGAGYVGVGTHIFRSGSPTRPARHHAAVRRAKPVHEVAVVRHRATPRAAVKAHHVHPRRIRSLQVSPPALAQSQAPKPVPARRIAPPVHTHLAKPKHTASHPQPKPKHARSPKPPRTHTPPAGANAHAQHTKLPRA